MTRTLTLEINGRKFVYSTLVGDRDPMEMTLSEWRSAPLLTAMAMAPLSLPEHAEDRKDNE
ncbi:hypothetical protein CO661_13970 [Sinorhizobium fredii]|uniref:Uncharacterized protein n=1 Tax=Rhizobium fredii TaxID=380 RepID=A0A2A6LXL2_RHIFR|nr:hypothetical protein [Sinorhizobium fredii]PDT47284.1 hypothetical protein CO661_13970 [Sinorhizobium fredii]